MLDIIRFYQSIVIDSLRIDMENCQLLKDSVRDACSEADREFNESEFQDLLIEMIKKGEVVPCTYDQNKQHWQEEKFKIEDIMNYWFKLKSGA